MVRLHLIGFTTDLKNLIFATRRGAKRGGYVVEIDKRLLGALDEVAKLEAEANANPRTEVEQAPPPEEAAAPAARTSALSPKEIQALLREGKSEEQVAKLAETDVSWIRRFTAPIIAERAEVIDSVRAGLIVKPRLGPSAMNVGDAIQQNLSDKRVQMDPESFERSWKASRRAGLWQVVFQYSSRGKRRLARFSFDPESRQVTAANAIALDVAWRPNNLRRARRAEPGQNAAKKTAPKATRTAKGASGSRSAKKTAAKKTRRPAPVSRRAKSSVARAGRAGTVQRSLSRQAKGRS